MNQNTKKEAFEQRLKQQENSRKSTQMRHEQRWIFHWNRSIESDDIDRNYGLISKEKHQHIVVTFLWLNIFFFDDYQIVVQFLWTQCKRYYHMNKGKFDYKRVMFDVLYMLEQQKSNFLG